MAVRDILLLGNPKLYNLSQEVQQSELGEMTAIVQDLHDTLMEFRSKWGVGRAIAAPQIGVFRRLVYMFFEDKPTVFINPILWFNTAETVNVWDDCMSFPELLVRISRTKSCIVTYKDLEWNDQELDLEGDLNYCSTNATIWTAFWRYHKR
jgi:peptide deformylase